jgi:GntR family transcriptional regulator
MQFRISTSSRKPIYQQLAVQVRAAVAQGRLRTGERLPSVRELSRELVVNPNTIARAYTELERDGVLHTRQGMGVFVAKPSTDLTKPARRKMLLELLDGLLTEAVYLGFSRDEVLETVSARLDRFQWEQYS